ncbi:hypothetical protein [Silanimonas lenta]|jgi:hypothetical protein|uniref:hypothetical protein n=1 Tax=Silanimonas lenta TaxID=265429 RepID=UPI0003FB3FCE|nr:hypothetical protein [Silanimonas lenta]
MLRSSLLLMFVLALPSAGTASVQDEASPAAAEASACESPASKDAGATGSSDVAGRRADAPAARPASASHPAPSRPLLPRWNRLLPGMFR